MRSLQTHRYSDGPATVTVDGCPWRFDLRLDNYFADYAAKQARALKLTLDDLRAWTPSSTTRGRRASRTGP